MKLKVLKTTDNKFISNVFEFPSLPKPGWEIPVGDFNFDIIFVKEISKDKYSFRNFNYEVIAEIVGE